MLSIQVMGVEVIACNHLQAPAASRATRELQVKRVSQVGGLSLHQFEHVVILSSKMCGQLRANCDVSLRHGLQAPAASRATRVPLVRQVSRVG